MSAPRVLLVAYQCGPGMGSVSQIGWEWYARMCRRAGKVTLVTHVRNRPALTAAGAPLGNSEVVYVDTEWFAAPLYRLSKRLFPKSEHGAFLLSSIDYFPFEWTALRQLRSRRREWDVVHRVTPVSTRAASRWHTLGLPVVLGPFNSNVPKNPAFHEYLSKEDSAWFYPVRALGRLPELLFGGHRKAAALLVATAATARYFPRSLQDRLRPMIENGVDLERFHASPWPQFPDADVPLRVVFTGRLVPFKGLHLLFQAAARLDRDHPLEIDVIGDGPMREEWTQAARRAGLEKQVRFLGNLPLDQVAQRMRESHVFCLPSVRESGGAVLLEAMACARPVIAVAFGGPAELVDDAVGRSVPCHGREAVVDGFEAALRDVFAHPEAWRRRGENAAQRARERYGWDTKIEQAAALYGEYLPLPQGSA